MKLARTLARGILGLLGLTVLLVVAFVVTTAALDRTNGAIMSNGVKREYVIYVPKSYRAARPTPLIISLHGAGAWPAQQQNMTHWDRLADEFGFIVVYPAAGGRIWRVSRPNAPVMSDVRFIADLVDSLKHRYDIDPARVYANGFSLGGAMTFALSCTLSDRIAAVGTVSAAQTLPWTWCSDKHPVPLINFHGTADLVPYAGGPSPDPFNPLTFPDVRTWTANWARRNACAPRPIESVVTPDVRLREYRDCENDASVELYTIEDGGHAWPGGESLPRWFFGRTTHTIDATRLMWGFFQAHPLRLPNGH